MVNHLPYSFPELHNRETQTCDLLSTNLHSVRVLAIVRLIIPRVRRAELWPAAGCGSLMAPDKTRFSVLFNYHQGRDCNIIMDPGSVLLPSQLARCAAAWPGPNWSLLLMPPLQSLHIIKEERREKTNTEQTAGSGSEAT